MKLDLFILELIKDIMRQQSTLHTLPVWFANIDEQALYLDVFSKTGKGVRIC